MNNDKHILACIGRSIRAEHVAAHTAWTSRRLAAPLALLRMIERHANAEPAEDRSNVIGVDAHDHPLSRLTADEERSMWRRLRAFPVPTLLMR